ncbi:MAG TPA: PEP-CTERM sorting domain-containing protein [Opitutaceae bacterium]
MKHTHHPRAGRSFAFATLLLSLSQPAGALHAQVLVDGVDAGAEVNVTGGATLAGGYIDLGGAPGSQGTINVDGAGSALTSTQNIAVGAGGVGVLNVTGGATVRTEGVGPEAIIFAGYGSGSSGAITVSGANSLLSAQTELLIGFNGSGTALVENGARIESRTNALTLGAWAGSSGTLTLTGGGTTAGFDLGAVGGFVSVIGNGGSGTLDVLDNASATFGRSINLGNLATGSGKLVVDGAGSTVTIANDPAANRTANLNVGWVGTGEVEIRNGGSIYVRDDVRIGGGGALDSSAAVGQVLVTGNGSNLTAGGTMLVGLGGTSSLTIADNAWVTANEVEVENASVTLTGANAGLNVANGLYLRSGGTLTAGGGYLNSSYTVIDGGVATFNQWVGLNAWNNPDAVWDIVNGGKLIQNAGLGIGNNAGHTAALNINGAGSAVSGAGNISVGWQGTGTVNVSSGGALGGAFIDLGGEAGSSGTINVSGGGSLVSATRNIAVGNKGAGTLTVANGATVRTEATDASPLVFVGFDGGSNGVLSVGGAGSTVSAQGLVIIGHNGTGTAFVSDGGRLESREGTLVLGNNAGAEGFLTVTGATSSIAFDAVAGGVPVIGNAGTGVLEVFGGADATFARSLTLGNQAGGDGTLEVDGNGSTVTITNAGGATVNFNVGWYGLGEVRVRNGGAISVRDEVRIGGNGDAPEALLNSFGYVQVTGAGSNLTAGGIVVGLGGEATLDIEDNAFVSANEVAVENAAVNISGNAGLNVANGLYLGSGGTLTVNGGYLNSYYTEIDGGGATFGQWLSLNAWNENQAANSAAWTVLNGGQLNASAGLLVGNNAYDTASLTINGAHSTVSAQTELIVGFNGTGTVLVENGGHIESLTNALTLGAWGDSNGTLTLTGAGTTGSFDLGALGGFSSTIGNEGTGTLNVLDGAHATFGRSLTLGNLATGQGTLIVDGAASAVAITNAGSATANLNVGWYGEGSAEISNGGSVTVRDEVRIGGNGAARDAIGHVSVTSGSALAAGGAIRVGLSGTGSLDVASATVTAPVLNIGEDGGTGTVTVGAGGLVTAGTYLNVGYGDNLNPGTGGSGTLTISNGGAVQAHRATIARPTASSGAVTVTGSGSRLAVTTDLGVGEGSGSASLLVTDLARVDTATFTQHRGNVTISAGGTLAATGAASIAKPGTLTLADGTLAASALTNAGTVRGSGTIDAASVTNSGTLDVSGATDRLVLTGNYTQTSTGTLRTGLELGTGDGALAHLVTGGNIGLNGTLDVAHSGYTAQLGDTIEILRSTAAGATLTGGFTRINNIDVSDTLSLETQFANGAFNLVVMEKASTAEVFSGTRSGNVDLAGTQTVTGPITLGGDAGRSGSLTLASGASLTTDQTITVGGAGGGSLIVGSGASIMTTDAISIGGSGALSLTTGGTLSAGSLTSDGVIGGSGTIMAGTFTNNGILGPGNSPGSITLDGDVIQTAAGLTLIEISGALAGTEYDFIHVTGDLTLDGTLEFAFLGDFNPVNAQTFTPITWDGTLAFGDNFVLAGLTQANGWTLTATFLDHSLLVTAVSAIPEPATYAALAGLATLGLALWRRRRSA